MRLLILALILLPLVSADSMGLNGFNTSETQIGNMKADIAYNGFLIRGSLTDGQPISRNGSDGTFEGQIGYLSIIPGESLMVCGVLTSSIVLNRSITSVGTCYTIYTGGITLDCNGFTITGSGTGYGVEADSVNYITIKNCYIQNFDAGILLGFVQLSYVENVTVYNSTRGFWIRGNSRNNKLMKVLADNNSYGVEFGGVDSAYTNTVYNSSIVDSSTADIYSSTDAQNNAFLNTTFDATKILWGVCSPCNFSVSWYGRVNVTNSTNAPLPANVNVSDNVGKSAFSSTAGASGLTSWFPVLDYYASSAGDTLFNNYGINASYLGYNLTESSFNFGGRDYTFNITLFLTGFIPSIPINLTYGSVVEVFRDLENRGSSEFPIRNYFLAALPLLGLAFVGLWKKDWLIS
jgi:hypothetical protein